MEEILHQLIGSLSHYLQCFVPPRWCRISSINSLCLWSCPHTTSDCVGQQFQEPGLQYLRVCLQTRWATHGKRLKGLKVAGSVERQTGGEKPFATRIATLCWPMSALCWPNLTVSCPKGGYVGSMFASLGPIPALS